MYNYGFTTPDINIEDKYGLATLSYEKGDSGNINTFFLFHIPYMYVMRECYFIIIIIKDTVSLMSTSSALLR